MSPVVMMNPPRLIDGPAQDPAAMLLRSARSDVAPSAAKDRVRAMLGLDAAMNEGEALPLPVMPKRAGSERKTRTPAITRFVPFQHLLAETKPLPVRKFGGVAVAAMQVAAIFAALFVRPFPRVEPAREAPVARHDEPEVSFLVAKAKKQETASTLASLPENGSKPLPSRKERFGTASSASRTASASEPARWNESIVGDEHAGMLAESAITDVAAAPEAAPAIAPSVSIPVAFQSGMAQPVRIVGTDPTYPMSARMRGVTGTVIMRCVITEKGLAQNCTILKSPAFLDEAVLDVVRTWRFTPMTWQGRTVSVNYVFKYVFKLG